MFMPSSLKDRYACGPFLQAEAVRAVRVIEAMHRRGIDEEETVLCSPLWY